MEPKFMRQDLIHVARDILESQSRARANAGRSEQFPWGTDVITTEQIVDEAKKLEAFINA